MKISVIFILYKTPKKELASVRKQISQIIPSARFYTYDNSVRNKGYAYGINQIIKKIKKNTDIYVIANTDITLPKITSEELLAGLVNFEILGFAMEQKGKFYHGGKIDRWYLSGGLITRKPAKRFKEVDFVSGSLMIVKKEVFEIIGGFDQRFFMYYEDVDFCMRAKLAGFRVGIDNKIVYKHLEVSHSSPEKESRLATSHQKFFKKYNNFPQKVRMSVKKLLTQ